MRAFQIFASMSPEEAHALFSRMAESSPATFDQAVYAAASALKARPAYLRKQPLEKRTAAVRRALARVASNPAAEEMLAIYFLECRGELLVEWLDLAGVAHEEGSLKDDDPAEPDEATLRDAVQKFQHGDDDPDRRILLLAFAAQTSIDWPNLNAILEMQEPG